MNRYRIILGILSVVFYITCSSLFPSDPVIKPGTLQVSISFSTKPDNTLSKGLSVNSIRIELFQGTTLKETKTLTASGSSRTTSFTANAGSNYKIVCTGYDNTAPIYRGESTIFSVVAGQTKSVSVHMGFNINSAYSNFTASKDSIPADGSSTTLIKFVPRDAQGSPIGSGLSVTFKTSLGELIGSVNYNSSDQSYSQQLQASSESGIAVVSVQVNDINLNKTVNVEFENTGILYTITLPYENIVHSVSESITTNKYTFTVSRNGKLVMVIKNTFTSSAKLAILLRENESIVSGSFASIQAGLHYTSNIFDLSHGNNYTIEISRVDGPSGDNHYKIAGFYFYIPNLEVTPTSITKTNIPLNTSTTYPEEFTVGNVNSMTNFSYNVTVTTGSNWLGVTQTSGIISEGSKDKIGITINTSGWTTGEQKSGIIMVDGGDAGTVDISVFATVIFSQDDYPDSVAYLLQNSQWKYGYLEESDDIDWFYVVLGSSSKISCFKRLINVPDAILGKMNYKKNNNLVDYNNKLKIIGNNQNFFSMVIDLEMPNNVDYDLFLYNSLFSMLDYSEGITNSERINMNDLADGTYFIKVSSYYGSSSIDQYRVRATWSEQVPTVSPDITTVSASPMSIPADGSSTSTIKVIPKDSDGNNIGQYFSISDVSFTTNQGSMAGPVAYNSSDQSYSQQLQSSTTPGTAEITAVVADVTISNKASVQFVQAVSPALTTISSNPQSIPADGSSMSTIKVIPKDYSGNNIGSKFSASDVSFLRLIGVE